MCAEYEIRKNNKEIRAALGSVSSDEQDGNDAYRPRIKLFSQAPIVTSNGDEYAIEPMRFSLKPPSMKFATFNARLFDFDEKKNKVVSLAEKRTWKKPLQYSRCLIPMTGFIEPIYTGDHAGEMVEFKDKKHEVIFAAGLCEKSKDPETGEPYAGFSIIMHTPDTTVKKVGHHRTPVFLQKSAFEDWFSLELEADEAVGLLLRKRLKLDLSVEKDRAMAKGWEKRVQSFIAKAEHEAHVEEMVRRHDA